MSTIFLKYALQLCGEENCNSQTELSNLQTELSDTEKGSCNVQLISNPHKGGEQTWAGSRGNTRNVID
jgi:hypothetical protein